MLVMGLPLWDSCGLPGAAPGGRSIVVATQLRARGRLRAGGPGAGGDSGKGGLAGKRSCPGAGGPNERNAKRCGKGEKQFLVERADS